MNGRRFRSLAAIAVVTVAFPAAAAASPYSNAVRADDPEMYWRLGEPDLAPRALDTSGHGFFLRYTSAALLDVRGAIRGDRDTALAVDDGAAARGVVTDAAPPAVFEAWIRMSGAPDTT